MLELEFTVRYITGVRELVRVDVDVLLQVLVLGKVPAAKVAHEPLEPDVMHHDVSPEAELVREALLTILHGANQ